MNVAGILHFPPSEIKKLSFKELKYWNALAENFRKTIMKK